MTATPTGHVLAAMVADAFDDCCRTGVAHTEPLTDEPADVRLSRGRAVQDDVARDDVFLSRERGIGMGAHDDNAARQALADVIIRIAEQTQRYAARKESCKRLPR